jgi:membrane protease YdiL (CAAX protease family)
MRARWITLTLALMLAAYTLLRVTSLDLVVAGTSAVLLLAAGRSSGLSWDDLGMARTTAGRGARWALVAATVVALGYVIVAVTPLHVLLQDSRFDDGWPDALWRAAVTVPLGTVLWEEIAFRGVLWSQLRSRWSATWATAGSSLLFGFWHTLPALRFAETNGGAESVASGTVVVIGTVVVTMVVTGAAGVLLCEMRRRSDSLLAPIGLHWAANAFGVLAVAAVAN